MEKVLTLPLTSSLEPYQSHVPGCITHGQSHTQSHPPPTYAPRDVASLIHPSLLASDCHEPRRVRALDTVQRACKDPGGAEEEEGNMLVQCGYGGPARELLRCHRAPFRGVPLLHDPSRCAQRGSVHLPRHSQMPRYRAQVAPLRSRATWRTTTSVIAGAESSGGVEAVANQPGSCSGAANVT